MAPLEIGLLLVAGLAAGTINTVVGSGSLISFPALLAVGLPPTTANITNNLGVLPGTISGAIACRRDLRGKRRIGTILFIASIIGGTTGAALLLILPERVFTWIVPVLIVLACVLVLISPRINARRSGETKPVGGHVKVSSKLFVGVFAAAIYGGYFGAAQGVILLGLLSITLAETMRSANALKNLIAVGANGSAALVFIVFAEVAWLPAILVGLGAIVGGQVGGRIGQFLPDLFYRILVVIIGIVAIVFMAWM